MASKIAFSATSPVTNDEVVAYESTLAAHRMKHVEPFTNEQIIRCIEEPDVVAMTGHAEEEHAERLLYYKNDQFTDGPPIMKAVVEHKETPGVLTSAFRTSRYSNDGSIVYMSSEYEERLTNG